MRLSFIAEKIIKSKNILICQLTGTFFAAKKNSLVEALSNLRGKHLSQHHLEHDS